ncbi:DNA repair protein [Kosakonia cowanii]|uniref:HumD family translesion DNA polymerase n=1 Tax=Kosakonia cowanii TaxID=208223 RepID=UPI003B20C60D
MPSPAADYMDEKISLDHELIRVPSATYFLRAAAESRHEAIKKGALLILDMWARPVDGSIVMCHLGERVRMLRLRLYPRPRQQELHRPEITYPMTDENCGGRLVFKGVITYIINDARSGEFDDNPVM